MRWDPVARSMASVIAARPVINGIYGEFVRMASGSANHRVPLLEYRIITNTEMEQWEPIVIQWDQWTDTYEELVASERELMDVLHREEEVWLGDVMVLTKFLDGAELADPDRQGYFGRAIRFRLVAIADRYVVDQLS
jgi:hypothetical protein